MTITPSQAGGTLNLAVLNSSQSVMGSGQSQTGAVTVTLNLAAGKTYYVKSTSATGNLFTYSLTVVKNGTGGGALAGHAEERGDGTPARLSSATTLFAFDTAFVQDQDSSTFWMTQVPSASGQGETPADAAQVPTWSPSLLLADDPLDALIGAAPAGDPWAALDGLWSELGDVLAGEDL